MATPEEMYSEKERELLRLREASTSSGQLQRSAPAEFMPATGVGVPGGETVPNPPAPDMGRMVKDTAAAQTQLRQEAGPFMTDEQKLMAGGAAGLGLLGWLASKFMSGTDSDQPPSDRLRDRSIKRDPTMDQSFKGPQEPTFLPEPTPAPAQPQAVAEPKPLSPLEQEALREKQLKNQRLEQAIQLDKEKAERARLEHEIKQTQASLKQQQASGGSITETEAKMLGASNLASQTKEATAQQKQITGKAGTSVAPTVANVVESGEMPAPKGPVAPKKEQRTFKSAAEIPEGMVFRPDVGNLDRSLVNILGPEHRLYAKELINEGKMFGHSNDLNKDVSKITTDYFKALQSEVPETILSRDARKAQGIESKFGTYGSMLGKAAKVGGVAGTLMTVAQSANAKEAASALGEALLPLGITPSAVEPGTLTAKQLKAFEEAQKRGSPYRSVPPPTR